jgi:hypothetical protein
MFGEKKVAEPVKLSDASSLFGPDQDEGDVDGLDLDAVVTPAAPAAAAATAAKGMAAAAAAAAAAGSSLFGDSDEEEAPGTHWTAAVSARPYR